MKIAIKSPHGEAQVDWADYALLRDNIQHFIEAGKPSASYAAIHSIERAVDEGRVAVDAARLRSELLGACYKLRRLDLEDCAISLRTRALVTRCAALPECRGTAPARLAGWRLPTREQSGSLIRHLKPLISIVLKMTKRAVDGDRIAFRLDRSQ